MKRKFQNWSLIRISNVSTSRRRQSAQMSLASRNEWQRGSGSIVSDAVARGSRLKSRSFVRWYTIYVFDLNVLYIRSIDDQYTCPVQRISRWFACDRLSRFIDSTSWSRCVCFPVEKCNHLWITSSSCNGQVIWPAGRLVCIHDPWTRLIDR